jgi:hypothetical protein
MKSEAELLAVCKAKQGQYLPVGHGSGSWATSYSYEFIAAAWELHSLYAKKSRHLALWSLSQAFRKSGIRSCRGSEMTLARVEYLYKTHLQSFVPSPSGS